MGVPAEEMNDEAPEVEIPETEDGNSADEPSSEASEEIEVVLESGDAPEFTQSQVNDIVARRVARLKKQGEPVSEELARAQEENRLLKLALEQKEAAGPPKASDFEDGEMDPAYQRAQDEFRKTQTEAEVARQVEERLKREEQARQSQEQARRLEASQREHYERASKLNAPDYEATEDAAIEALGSGLANQVIANLPDSHILLYYLGKNPGKASSIARLIRDNPVHGVAELGRLAGQVRVKPKSPKAPEPEDELEGASSLPLSEGPKGVTYS